MADEWKRHTLEEVYEFRSGLSKPRSAFGSGYPFLAFKDVFYNSAVPELTELVDSTQSERLRCSIRRGDVFLTRTSETMDELGMSSVALRDIPDATFNGFTKRLRPKDANGVIPEYARYYFRSPKFRQEVTAMSSLSTRASLNNAMLGRLSITIPPSREQEAIAHILGTLDDKIELNRAMNQTLEEMARALFKSWFVDFDPVHAKARGEQPPGLDPAIAALFPSGFVETELGLVPEGWRVGSIYDVSEVIYGAPFSSKHFNDEQIGLPLIRIRDLKTHSPSIYTDEVHPKGTVVKLGDIVVGMDGEFRVHRWQGNSGYLNQRVCMFQPKKNIPLVFLSESLIEPLAFFERSKTGTTVIHLGKRDIDNIRVMLPENSVLETFGSIAEPLYQLIIRHAIESRTLAELRDTLLPKLMSGELRMPAEAAIAAHPEV